MEKVDLEKRGIGDIKVEDRYANVLFIVFRCNSILVDRVRVTTSLLA